MPCSCRNGICTTCAGRVIANPDSKKASRKAFCKPRILAPHAFVSKSPMCVLKAMFQPISRFSFFRQEAIHGLSAEQSKNGFVLTCQTHPCGPGLEVELGMYDTVYESQYGQYEKKVNVSLVCT